MNTNKVKNIRNTSVTLESLDGRYQDFCKIAHTLIETVYWDTEIKVSAHE